MYKKYIEEQLTNRFVHEAYYGFLTYFHDEQNGILQLEEIYIKPEYRRKGFASKLYDKAEEIAIEKHCKELKGSIIIGTKNAEGSMICLLKNGYNFHYTDNIIIYLKKEIGE